MPDLLVCTGKAFGVGPSKELVIAGSGTKLWTLAGSVTANNGLNTDPVNGLWTAPHGCYSFVSKQSSNVLSVTLAPAASYTYVLSPVAIVNPSGASQMRIAASVIMRAMVTMPNNSLVQTSGSLSWTTAAAAYGMGSMAQNTGTSVPMVDSRTENAATLVAAGATATLTPVFQVACGGASAAVTVTGFSFEVTAIGWLIDPTQAGGVS